MQRKLTAFFGGGGSGATVSKKKKEEPKPALATTQTPETPITGNGVPAKSTKSETKATPRKRQKVEAVKSKAKADTKKPIIGKSVHFLLAYCLC